MAAPSSAIVTAAPPRASPPLPVTLPVMTADCATNSWNAAPDNTSSAPAHTIALNVRGLIIMTPPSVACGPHQAPQRQGLGAQRREVNVIVHLLSAVRKTAQPPLVPEDTRSGYDLPGVRGRVILCNPLQRNKLNGLEPEPWRLRAAHRARVRALRPRRGAAGHGCCKPRFHGRRRPARRPAYPRADPGRSGGGDRHPRDRQLGLARAVRP